MTMDQGAEILTPAEAAQYLRVHRETLYDLIRSGTIRASKVGGRWRIQKASLDTYLQKDTSHPGIWPGGRLSLVPERTVQGPGMFHRREQTGAKRVLVVDDSPEIREFFEIALGRRGHVVVCVPNGHDAVQQVKQCVYDLVFIDLLMPVLDGVDTLKAIREIDPDPTIVLITGYPEGELVTKALGLGPFVLLDKPIRVSDLLKVVEG